jgi:DnaJ-class molecular chaperone
MPQHTPRPRLCRACDGFATAAITTGTRHHDGSRVTVPVICPSCKGTGHQLAAATVARAGR